MDDSDAYGPPLPPGFKSNKNNEDNDSVYGPSIPSKLEINPIIPENVYSRNGNDKEASCDDEMFGPMPPSNGSIKESSKKNELDNINQDDDDEDEDDMYGPALPPHLLNKKTESHGSFSTSEKKQIIVNMKLVPSQNGKTVNSFTSIDIAFDDKSKNESISGPVITRKAFNEEEYRIRELELRAKRMRDKLEGKGEKKLERETWMLELPTDKPKLLGLSGPRQFLSKTPAERGDRTVWTDSPAEREARKQQGTSGSKETDIELTPQMLANKKRDAETAAAVESYNEKKRAKPLVDMHKDKMVLLIYINPK
ncbi:unnamed protein product [Meganyctiphanes norvegica]|uniref:DUF3752 domain-containing protein n=1 Tax=Meganyctiphanes norvegica TaxID=48144 RepID=A0AAV2R1W4_MEGNR